MLLQATFQHQKHEFEVTALVDHNELYFLIREGAEIILARRENSHTWSYTGSSNITDPIVRTVLEKIEHTSAYMLLDQVTDIEQLKSAA
ncbi:hypothetical protein SAMN05192574_104763 [Mucilaginibacter gossypiicola]|uniref:Uncharacterized protein n=1 Tax=Mucilaginibacter gossypiicola TaxID=551995 RepID=A0A1H8KT17_9SPHI|nr:hypothetical protein [Mucilaginibacter gossypiicola]SEN96050.1 hypothetical protein SAMN05192574_104763 [Mucilaginibacter gossypiicola]